MGKIRLNNWGVLWVIFWGSLLGFSSCSVTKHVPDGAYLLNSVELKIERDSTLTKFEMIAREDLENYVRQNPAGRFLGTNFPVWLYLQAQRRHYTWWGRAKQRISNPPVYLDTAQTRTSAEGMKIYMDSRGFLNSTSGYNIQLGKRKAKVTYNLNHGTPYRLGTIQYNFRDDFVKSVILGDTLQTLLHTGDVFDVNVLDKERARITDYLKNQGYYNFSVNNITYFADSTGGDNIINLMLLVRRYNVGYDAQGEAILENNHVYRISDIYVHSGYNPAESAVDTMYASRLDTVNYRGLNIVYDTRKNLRSEILRQAINIYPNSLYDAHGVKRTYDNLMRLGYYRSVSVLFADTEDPLGGDNQITFIGDLSDTTLISALTTERYLKCNIFCTPATRQSYSLDLEGTQSSEYLGVLARLGYQNRNLLRGAGIFDANFQGGYEFMFRDLPNSYELGVTMGFSFPEFITPLKVDRYNRTFNPRTKVEFAINAQSRPYYQRILSSGSWGYQWGNGRRSTYTFKPIDIAVIKMHIYDTTFLDNLKNPYLVNSFKSQFIGGLTGGYLYSNQRKDVWSNSVTFRLNYETNGNLYYGLSHLFNAKKYQAPPASSSAIVTNPYYRLFGIQYAQYIRLDARVSRRLVLGPKTSLVGRLHSGWGYAYGNSESLPFERLFYVGGVNSMRGWPARTLGPGNAPRVPFRDPNGQRIYPSQVANFLLEANLEFRFPVWGFLYGATFVDVGNIWFVAQGGAASEEVFRINRFDQQLGFNTGLGARLDFSFFVFRLDWGVQLHNPNEVPAERWVVRNFKLSNSALSFGVGFPF